MARAPRRFASESHSPVILRKRFGDGIHDVITMSWLRSLDWTLRRFGRWLIFPLPGIEPRTGVLPRLPLGLSRLVPLQSREDRDYQVRIRVKTWPRLQSRGLIDLVRVCLPKLHESARSGRIFSAPRLCGGFGGSFVFI